ncbi:MAG TPA: rRNA maturation RNase YbeY [Methylomirabilota bacterium]|nr:rRNA maturation RNase YbeY [Methylomirabilota bacterium]
MPAEVSIANRQRIKPLNPVFVRRLTRLILQRQGIKAYEVGLVFVEPKEMAYINENFLDHKGSTDVITFDYSGESAYPSDQRLTGEIVISVADAIEQAALFRTTWQSEVIRYVAHGILHLLGYDDLEPKARSMMKKAENDLVAWLQEQVDFAGL